MSPQFYLNAKKVSDPLDASRASQLARYFHTTKARIAILTDGIVYKFFSDLDAENTMDTTPFLEVDITRLETRDLNALNYFSKNSFNVDEARAAASDMKYIRGDESIPCRGVIASPRRSLSAFSRAKSFSGPMFQSRIESFTGLVKLAFQGFVNDRINSTLQRASDIVNTGIDDSEPSSIDEVESSAEDPQDADSDGVKSIVTTVEEVEGYEIVRTILSDFVDPERIVMRDTHSYCGVLFDNNNRKPICRLHFNRPRKYLGLLDEERRETRYLIESVDEISNYAEELRKSVGRYLDEE